MEKKLLIRKFGGSLYVPLTDFFRSLGLKENDTVNVILDENEERIIIERI